MSSGTLTDFFNEVSTIAVSDQQFEYIVNNKQIDLSEYSFFRLTSIMFDEKFPHREALENVISTIENDLFSFVYILRGSPKQVTIYIGVTVRQKKKSNMTVQKYGRKLENAFNGYFHGSTLEKLSEQETKDEILLEMDRYMRGSIIAGIPSVQKSASQKNLDFQGVDRLINSVGQGYWMMMVVAQRVNSSQIPFMKEIAYDLYDTLHTESKRTVQLSENETNGTSDSKTNGTSSSIGSNASKTKALGRDSGNSESNGSSKDDSKSFSETNGSNCSKSMGKAHTVEEIDKKRREILDYMDDIFFKRLKIAQAKGFYKTSVFILGENTETHDRLKAGVLAIYQGDEVTENPLRSYPITVKDNIAIKQIIQNFSPATIKKSYHNYTATLFGIPTHKGQTELATYLTPQELSYMVGLPQKEIIGLPLKEGVDFGLNFEQSKDDQSVELGYIVNRGKVNIESVVKLTEKQINKHIFIAGVTGSGKTTTCQKLLLSGDMPFLVIEPAKTEYRGMALLPGMENLVIYTLGNEQLSPFRLNPFELLKGESITSHVDMLKATFTAAFPMEAAMPQILEEAMYECYKDCGWNIEDNSNRYVKNPWKSNGEYFPTLEMLVEKLKSVVENQGFGNELKDNYIGSLVSRLKNLTIGSKGLMLNCKLSINFEQLLDERVIIEMEDIKSAEDKALFMGLILSRLSEALKHKYRKNNQYKHITLVEEAHRLLSKVDIGDAPSKKTAVETFSDMLAEVRKYGEGLVIVDQIPNKLASEVLKNTNTKIIHRIFARDDKEVIGDTMMMDDRQKDFLSSLPVGQAILFTEGMHKPANIAIKATTNTSDNEISDKLLKELGARNTARMPRVYYPLASILGLPTSEEAFIRETLNKGLGFFKNYRKTDDIYEAYEQLQQVLAPLKDKVGFTDKKILEVLLYYKIYKKHNFILLDFDFTRFESEALEIYNAIHRKELTPGITDENPFFNYFNL